MSIFHPFPRVELRGSKDDNYDLNIKLYRNGKLHSLLGWTLTVLCKKGQSEISKVQTDFMHSN